jgi:glycosyltransferase involved in cell wall biosynthesis
MPQSEGGTDAYALRSALSLVPRGHTVFLVGQGQPGPAFGRVNFVPVPTRVQITSRHRSIYFLKGFLLGVASTLTAIRFLRTHPAEVDIIHSNSNLGTFVLKRMFPEKPIAYTLHDPLSGSTPARGWLERIVRFVNNGLIERLALRSSDHIIAVSSEIRTQAERLLGSSDRLSLLYPFSTRPAAPPGTLVSSMDPRLPDTPFVLGVGAQTGRKRFDLLIRALAQVRPGPSLVLVGSGSDRARLVETARETGASSRVLFLDHVSDGALAGMYHRALACVMVSEREGFPTSLLEAVMCGTPVLYFTDGPTADLEGDQSDFFRVVHSMSETDIVAGIQHLRDTRGLLDRRRIERWARTRFPTSDSLARELNHIYDQIRQLPESPRGPTA